MLLLEGKQVTTLEGLGTRREPAPIQRAFIEEQAAQCGYCIAGMMMRAQALLQRNPKPTDAQIRAALRAQSLPLRHAYAHPARRAPRGAADAIRAGCFAEPAGRRPMNAPRHLDRRSVLAGGGALIVSFSLRRRLRARAGSARLQRRAPSLPGSLKTAPYPRFLDPYRRRRRHHGLHRQGRARPGLQDRAPADRRRRTRRRLRVAEARHRRHAAAPPNEGYTVRQPFDAGQRHGDPECGGAGARAADRGSGAAARSAALKT